MKYKGVPKVGIEFYTLLFNSKEFTEELGKMTLAAELINHLNRKGITVKENKTLGGLITQAESNGTLDKNVLMSLKSVKNLRNEFVHRIYSMFSGLSQKSMMPIADLIDTDVITYQDYAWQLTCSL